MNSVFEITMGTVMPYTGEYQGEFCNSCGQDEDEGIVFCYCCGIKKEIFLCPDCGVNTHADGGTCSDCIMKGFKYGVKVGEDSDEDSDDEEDEEEEDDEDSDDEEE